MIANIQPLSFVVALGANKVEIKKAVEASLRSLC